jgi:hypothetical protein
MKSFFIQIAKRCNPGFYFQSLPDGLVVCYHCPESTYNFGESTYNNCPNSENDGQKSKYSPNVSSISNYNITNNRVTIENCMSATDNISIILSGYIPDLCINPSYLETCFWKNLSICLTPYCKFIGCLNEDNCTVQCQS